MNSRLDGACARTGARRIAWLLGTTVLAMASVARADPPTPQDENTVQEVIVTAQKRSESIQRVPMSIQALDTRKLEQQNVTQFADYAKLLPSLSYQTTAPGQTSIYMRGVASGENGNHSGPLPSVGTYLDEQPITTIAGTLDIHIYDIARVESLAGPQGTLYGASSEAGTVRIITNKPSSAGFAAGYDVQGNTVAHGGVGYVAEGFVNQPLSDNIAVRLVGWDEHDAGFINNIHGQRTFPTGAGIYGPGPATLDNSAYVKRRYNTVDTAGARAALKIDLNDSWTVMPTIIAQTQKANGSFGYEPQFGYLNVERFGPDTLKDQWYQAALTITGKLSRYDVTYSGGHFARRVDSVADYTDYSYTYDQVHGSGVYWQDSAGHVLPTPRQQIFGRDRFWKDSHELRIASPSTDRFRFVAGLFWQVQRHYIIQDYEIDGFSSSLSVPNWPNTIWLTDQMRVDRDKAAYVEASFDITDQLTLTAGIRAYDYKNSLKGFFGFSEAYDQTIYGPPPTVASGFGYGGINCISTQVYRGGPGCVNLDRTASGHGETHKLNLTYHIDPDKLIYATYSTGFRPGGVNRNGNLPPYLADTLTNYEFGWKTSWLDHRLRWNGAVFQEDWQNFQFSFLGLNSLTVVANAGAARIRGLESDVTWVLAPNLTFTAAGAYTDAKLVKPYCGATDSGTGAPISNCPGAQDPFPPEAPSGQQLPVTPKFKANATLRYVFDLHDWNMHLQATVAGQDATWADLRTYERNVLGRLPGYATTDVSFGGERHGLSWELFAKNLFDSHGEQSRYAACTLATNYLPKPPYPAYPPTATPPGQVPICGAYPYAVPITPRLIGFRIGQKF